jgi:hypothetical protein
MGSRTAGNNSTVGKMKNCVCGKKAIQVMTAHLTEGQFDLYAVKKPICFNFLSKISLIRERQARCRYQNNLPAAYIVF